MRHGTAAFHNVVVPSRDNYVLTFRYAFAYGNFPKVTDRPEGVAVNGVVITYNMHFPITYSFEDYEYAKIIVPLNAGKNTIQIFNVSNHGVARLDTMIVTPSFHSLCSDAATAPPELSATPAFGRKINLQWKASAWPPDCTVRYYDVFRGTSRDFIPSARNQITNRLTSTSYSDVTVSCGTTYYYVVEALDIVGASASLVVKATSRPCGMTTSGPESPPSPDAAP
jgi:hypothetical protein